MPSSIDPSNGAAIHWRVDEEWLHIAVAARCTGWVGFGLAEAGGMLGSDMALFVGSRPSEIVDAHVIENFYPEEDDCQQDWILVDSSGLSSKSEAQDSEDFLMFEARRKLDTGDPQDNKVIQDANPSIPPHRIVAAWGNSAEVSYHGANVARGAVRFYTAGTDEDSAFEKNMMTNAEGSFMVQAKNYTIPSGRHDIRRILRDSL